MLDACVDVTSLMRRPENISNLPWAVGNLIRLSIFGFSICDIIKFIEALNLSKARGHDEISICLIELCSFSMAKPMHIIFKNGLEKECFLRERKKVSGVPVCKRDSKEMINNSRPVSLLPIWAAAIFNSLFK